MGISRKAVAAKTESTTEVIRGDAPICSDRAGDAVHIRIGYLLAEIGNGVGKADFGGYVSVETHLCNFSTDDRHPEYSGCARAQHVMEFTEACARSGARVADDDQVRSKKSLDGISECDKVRIVTDRKVGMKLLARIGFK